jgi:hypothetical protein
MRSAANDALTPADAREGRRLLEFRMLGPLEAIDGDHALTPVGAIQRALPAILLLNASGATALQVRVSQLRKALGRPAPS